MQPKTEFKSGSGEDEKRAEKKGRRLDLYLLPVSPVDNPLTIASVANVRQPLEKLVCLFYLYPMTHQNIVMLTGFFIKKPLRWNAFSFSVRVYLGQVHRNGKPGLRERHISHDNISMVRLNNFVGNGKA